MTSLITTLGRSARDAALPLAALPDEIITKALLNAARAITENAATILTANKIDVDAAQTKNLTPALLDRLTLTQNRLLAAVKSIETIAALPSPIGKTLSTDTRPNGLKISRRAVPLGVLGIIYESRPNVTADAIALAVKSKNCAILRGGSESLNSNQALYKIFETAFAQAGIPAGAIGFVGDTDRQHVGAMLTASEYIDVIIPRGGKSLTERVMNEAKMPVFAHLDGICHVYLHSSADANMARDVVLNAKMRRTGICGAAETLLIDHAFSRESAKDIISALLAKGCELVGDEYAQSLHPSITKATDDDWATEYLDAKLSIKFVASVEDAVRHINHFGSHHTDSIIATDDVATTYFFQNTDSAIVMHNASTQFADGGEFGMGAEIGIATGRFHARGPVGLEQLTTYKYIVEGNGQIRP